MQRAMRFFVRHAKIWRQTALISAVIVAVTVFSDFAINVLLLNAIENYTPWSTLAIVLLVAPPFVFTLLLQKERVREAQSALASEQAARAMAEAINEARSQFLANTSHELRTPLSGVIGYAELMLENAEEEGRANESADLQRILTSARRLLNLVDDLLDLSKLEAHGIELQPAPFDVAEMLREAVASATPRAADNDNQITLTIADNVRIADTDRARLSQCVRNLLSNAVKFTEHGTVGVRASSELRDQCEYLVIEVRDSGAGISAEQQKSLFEPFMQTRHELQRPQKDTGLGLAITRKLARLMGGDITLKSELGKGATFTLRVPMRFDRTQSSQKLAA